MMGAGVVVGVGVVVLVVVGAGVVLLVVVVGVGVVLVVLVVVGSGVVVVVHHKHVSPATREHVSGQAMHALAEEHLCSVAITQ